MPILALPLDGSSNQEIAARSPLRYTHVKTLYQTLIGESGLDIVMGASGTGLPIPGSSNTAPALDVSGAIRTSGIVATGAQTGIYSSTKGYFGDSLLITGGAVQIEHGLVTPGHVSGNSGIFTAGITAGTSVTALNGITGLALSGYAVVPSGGTAPTPGASFASLYVSAGPGGEICLAIKMPNGTVVTGGSFI